MTTRALTGRLARAIATDYVKAAASPDAPRPAPYPVQRGLTQADEGRRREGQRPSPDAGLGRAVGGDGQADSRGRDGEPRSGTRRSRCSDACSCSSASRSFPSSLRPSRSRRGDGATASARSSPHCPPWPVRRSASTRCSRAACSRPMPRGASLLGLVGVAAFCLVVRARVNAASLGGVPAARMGVVRGGHDADLPRGRGSARRACSSRWRRCLARGRCLPSPKPRTAGLRHTAMGSSAAHAVGGGAGVRVDVGGRSLWDRA